GGSRPSDSLIGSWPAVRYVGCELEQVPFTQYGVLFGHTFPHAPQLLGSANRLTHAPEQTVFPDGQTQFELKHTNPLPHTVEQPPQCAALEVKSTHVPPQSAVPFGHTQLPFEQVLPPVQVTPHPPQASESLERSKHSPPHLV